MKKFNLNSDNWLSLEGGNAMSLNESNSYAVGLITPRQLEKLYRDANNFIIKELDSYIDFNKSKGMENAENKPIKKSRGSPLR